MLINSITKEETVIFFYCSFFDHMEKENVRSLDYHYQSFQPSSIYSLEDHQYALIYCYMEDFEEVSTMVLKLQDIQQSRIGIIPVADSDKIHAIIEDHFNTSIIPPSFQTLALMTLDNGSSKSISPNTVRVSRNDCSIKHVQSLLESKKDLVIMDGHSDGIRFHLNDSDICHDNHQKTLPSFYPKQLSDVAILNICSGLRPVYHDDKPLGLSLFGDGAVKHVIAPARVKGASVFESILALALMKVGCSLGEVTYYMNTVLKNAGVDLPEYLLVGHPLKRLAKKQNYEGSLSSLSSDSYEVITQSSRPIVKIKIKDQSLINKAKMKNIRVYSPTLKRDLYYGFSTFDDEMYLFLFSWEDLPLNFEIKIFDIDILFSEVFLGSQIQSSIENLEVMKLSRPALKKGPVSEISNLVVNANKSRRMSAYNALVIGQWFKKREKLMNSILEANSTLLNYNEKYVRIPLTDRYEELFIKEDLLLKGTACPHCHSVVRELSLKNGETKRKTITCARCGVLEDTPSESNVVVSFESNGNLSLKLDPKDGKPHSYGFLVKAIADNRDEDIELFRQHGILKEHNKFSINLPSSQNDFEWIRMILFVDFNPWYFSIPYPKNGVIGHEN